MLNCMISGRITHDPKIIHHKESNLVIVIDIATKNPYTDKTDFLPFKAFKNNATFISNHIQKGDLVCVKFTIQNNNYVSEGKTIYQNECIVESIELSSRPQKNTGDNNSMHKNKPVENAPVKHINGAIASNEPLPC